MMPEADDVNSSRMEEVSGTNEAFEMAEDRPSNGEMDNEKTRNELQLENTMDANASEDRPSNGPMSTEEARKEQELEDRTAVNVLEPPKAGMIFKSFEEFFQYYKEYGKQEGFGVRKTTSSLSYDQKAKHFTVSCSQSGKTRSIKQNQRKRNRITRPETRTGCKARVNATVFLEDGTCRVNSIMLEHNHDFGPIDTWYYVRNRNRENTKGARRRRGLLEKAGVGVSENLNSLDGEAGASEIVPFSEKDCRNYVEKARSLGLGVEDAKAISDYFLKMQSKNSSFFYVMNLDEDAQIKDAFWADARSRAAYEEFGDVVTFDTTYLKNKYDIPLVSFVGVNHHGQLLLFGCGLISNQDTETYIWLFKSWLSCMSARAPKAIITDQDRAMQKAIEDVFPNTRHRWCLWHVMNMLPEKLRGYSMNESVKIALQCVVYDSLTQDEFEKNWRIFIGQYNLQRNEWLHGLYDERHRWVPVFVKSVFWAGMSITQHSECMDSYFDGCVNSTTTLKQFVEQYDNTLRSKAENEHQADLQSFSSPIPSVTHYGLEKQFQTAYTNAKFKEFQMELIGKIYCDVFFVREQAGIIYFEVTEDRLIREWRKQVVFKVCLNAKNWGVHCSCEYFESRGILCRHSISVLIKRQIELVPSRYILPRWRKKRCQTLVRIGYDELCSDLEAWRYDKLHKIFEQAAGFAVDSDDKCIMLSNCMLQMIDKLRPNAAAYISSYPAPQATTTAAPAPQSLEKNP